MMEQRTQIKRLGLWFSLNLIIFIVCYLNYRLQLKHRYLFKTLNVGLCFSRAAAMVINFNLLLVWLPMCKYSLTWVAYLANGSLGHQKLKRQRLISSQHQMVKQQIASSNDTRLLQRLSEKLKFSIEAAISRCQLLLCWVKINSTNSFLLAVDHCKSVHTICATTITIASVIHTVAHLMNVINFSKNYDPILSDLNMAEYKGQNPLQLLVSIPGITGILMLLILILMSLSSLDIIRALSFDLFQIFHRLSIIFVILLVLHPASHVLKEQSNILRHDPDLCYNNSVMMALRLAQDSSSPATLPVSLIERDHDAPPFAQPVSLAQNSDGTSPAASKLLQAAAAQRERQIMSGAATDRAPANKSESYRNNNVNNNTEPDLKLSLPYDKMNDEESEEDQEDNDDDGQVNENKDNYRAATTTTHKQSRLFKRQTSDNENYKSSVARTRGRREEEDSRLHGQVGGGDWTVAVNSSSFDQQQQQCLDPLPLFVAQNSICWYALSAGLSCYLLDLILRKRRRSKGTIQLLDVRADTEGNLIELIFNNNHKRFAHWLPGQFVYLNCPQVANFEWHPFTISSMDNANRLFTLHIKTGGDWTRKLRAKLGLALSLDGGDGCDSCSRTSSGSTDSMSSLSTPATTFKAIGQDAKAPSDCNITISSDFLRHETPILPDFVPRNNSGEPLVECTKLVRISYDDGNQPPSYQEVCDAGLKTSSSGSLYSISGTVCCSNQSSSSNGLHVGPLDLYIDGPFHSPFERLLEQPVSIGIANGVGWTAFSSAFQCVTNELGAKKFSRDWWKRQHQLYLDPSTSSRCHPVGLHTNSKLQSTKLHLMVIVTSIEQLRPFYRLALDYFDRINECTGGGNQQQTANPVREITAFITRSTSDDKTVTEFCARENISLVAHNNQQERQQQPFIQVNKTFRIHFGRPDFEKFLSSLRAIYADERKISVYCCGSTQVKKIVRELCRDLNKTGVHRNGFCQLNPLYSYHEESF